MSDMTTATKIIARVEGATPKDITLCPFCKKRDGSVVFPGGKTCPRQQWEPTRKGECYAFKFSGECDISLAEVFVINCTHEKKKNGKTGGGIGTGDDTSDIIITV